MKTSKIKDEEERAACDFQPEEDVNEIEDTGDAHEGLLPADSYECPAEMDGDDANYDHSSEEDDFDVEIAFKTKDYLRDAIEGEKGLETV